MFKLRYLIAVVLSLVIFTSTSPARLGFATWRLGMWPQMGDGPFTVTAKYKDNAQKIAAQRVALAGERLANLINDELK
jgi:hypothetical protein